MVGRELLGVAARARHRGARAALFARAVASALSGAQALARRHASAPVGRELLQWPRRRELGFSANPAPLSFQVAIRRSLLNRCRCVTCTMHPQGAQTGNFFAVTTFGI